MDIVENMKTDNKTLAEDLKQLAGTESSRVSVLAAIYIRVNEKMRLQNIQDVRSDISYGAKDFGLLPEKYVSNMNSIVKSYIEEINKFMKAYNDEFINIQNTLHSAEQKQKYYFFKIREATIMKNVCILAEKPEEEYEVLDQDILNYKKKLVLYERVIARCDKEFEDCKNRRERDFKELFEIQQEQSLAVVTKQNAISRFIRKIKNKFHAYEKFSKTVLQRHASKLNKMKTEIISNYVSNVKQDIVNFSSEIDGMTENA